MLCYFCIGALNEHFKYAAFTGIATVAGLVVAAVRDPVSPPNIYYKDFPVADISLYEGKDVALEAKPTFIRYVPGMTSEGSLEIGLEKEGKFIKAENRSLWGDLIRLRSANRCSGERMSVAYEILKQKILSANNGNITVKGSLDGDVVKTWSLVIDGVEYSLLER